MVAGAGSRAVSARESRIFAFPSSNFVCGQAAFAYEAGGGIDINAHHQKWAYRFAGDMVGTRFFSTNRFSPKISAGIVYKF